MLVLALSVIGACGDDEATTPDTTPAAGATGATGPADQNGQEDQNNQQDQGDENQSSGGPPSDAGAAAGGGGSGGAAGGTSADAGCESGYDPCVPTYPPDLDCPDVGGPVTVTGSDPHGLDADGDGSGCES